MRENDFLFASASVKTQEKRFVDKERYARILAGNLENAVRTLQEISYGEDLHLQSPSEYQKLLDSEFSGLIHFYKTVSPNAALMSALMKRYDYHNAKAIAKAKFLKLSNSQAMTYSSADIDISLLKEYISAENYMQLPRPMARALDKIDIYFATHSHSPRFLDITLDKAHYEDVLEVLKGVSDREIVSYFIGEIDTKNLISALRYKLLGMPSSSFKEQYIDGGTVTLKSLIFLIENTYEQSLKEFVGTPASIIAGKIIESVAKTGKIIKAEAIADNFLFYRFAKYKNEMSTVYPLLNYYLVKLGELKNLKLIFTVLSSGRDVSEIRQRMRGYDL